MSYGGNGNGASMPKMKENGNGKSNGNGNGNGKSAPKPKAKPKGDTFGSEAVKKVAAQRNAKMTPAFNRRQQTKGRALTGLTLRQTNKLREHAKLHKGGMASRHMKNMIRFQRAGDSFSVAHKKAVALDKK